MTALEVEQNDLAPFTFSGNGVYPSKNSENNVYSPLPKKTQQNRELLKITSCFFSSISSFLISWAKFFESSLT